MRSYSVSLSTANQAYAHLEDKGYIRAQAKSGYFVTRPASHRLIEPSKTTPPETSRSVVFQAPYLEMLEHASNPAYVPLGCAIPAPSLLAAEPLNALQARLLRSKGQQLNAYGSAQGLPELRREIAKLMCLHGSTVSQDEIVITSGCTEALGLALQTLTQPGDTIAVESPAYFGLLQVLERLKLKAWELPTSRDGIDPSALELALKSGTVTAVALSSSFTNPLGTMMPEPVKRSVLKLLDRYKTPLIEDDTYGGLGFGGCRPAPFSVCRTRPRSSIAALSRKPSPQVTEPAGSALQAALPKSTRPSSPPQSATRWHLNWLWLNSCHPGTSSAMCLAWPGQWKPMSRAHAGPLHSPFRRVPGSHIRTAVSSCG